MSSNLSLDTAESWAILDILMAARANWPDPAALLILGYASVRDFINPKLLAAQTDPSTENRNAKARKTRGRTQSFKNRLQSGNGGTHKDTIVAIKGESRLDKTLSFTHRSAYDFLRRRQVDINRPGVDVKSRSILMSQDSGVPLLLCCGIQETTVPTARF